MELPDLADKDAQSFLNTENISRNSVGYSACGEVIKFSKVVYRILAWRSLISHRAVGSNQTDVLLSRPTTTSPASADAPLT
jgi:hypothetical protein